MNEDDTGCEMLIAILSISYKQAQVTRNHLKVQINKVFTYKIYALKSI